MATKPLGPGPGAYMMPTLVGHPNHDARKYRNPMYSFGTVPEKKGKQFGPGPGAYYPDKVTRHGAEGTPKWSIYQRLDKKCKLFFMFPLHFKNFNWVNIVAKSTGPGPGAHNVVEHPNFKVNSPAYSIQQRHEFKGRHMVPAPNAYNYNVDSIKRSIPAYSWWVPWFFSIRLFLIQTFSVVCDLSAPIKTKHLDPLLTVLLIWMSIWEDLQLTPWGDRWSRKERVLVLAPVITTLLIIGLVIPPRPIRSV